MASNMGFIYYLQNPVTAEIFYVGFTQCSLNNRLRTHYQHLREYERGLRAENKRYVYLKNLRPDKATIHLLEIITDINIADEREEFYIKHFREINPNLTNMTDGGKGKCTSKYYDDEQRKIYGDKISKANRNKKKPEGFAQNLSDTRQGLNNPAARPIRDGGIIITKDREEFKFFKYGFEINKYFNNKYAYSNIHKACIKEGIYSKKPYGYEVKFFNEATKRVQDIVQSQYESIV